MSKKKQQGTGASSKGSMTRSRYAVLEDFEEEFPALLARIPLSKPKKYVADLVSGADRVSVDLKATIGKTKVLALDRAAAAGNENPAAREMPAAKEPAANKEPAARNKTSAQEDATATVGLKAVSMADPVQVNTPTSEAEQITITGGKIADVERKPWNDLFKDNRAPTHGLKLKYVPPKEKGLDFTDRIFPSMIEMWGHCLVGFFTGSFPGLKAIYELKNEWGVKCLVRSHKKGWVIFKFQCEHDRTKVLNGGPYSIFGKLLFLKVLSDDFSFDDEEFLKVPIWVKFPNLPLKLWNEEAMSEVASMVGVPLTTDKVTQEKSNHNFARVLIEVDISKPPQLSFPIRLPSRKVFKQHVVYETFPSFCFHCKEYGHHPFICKILAEKELSTSELSKVDALEKTPKDGVLLPTVFENTGAKKVQLEPPPATVLSAVEPAAPEAPPAAYATFEVAAQKIQPAAAALSDAFEVATPESAATLEFAAPEPADTHKSDAFALSAAAAFETGSAPNPTGLEKQTVSQGSAANVLDVQSVQGLSENVPKVQPAAAFEEPATAFKEVAAAVPNQVQPAAAAVFKAAGATGMGVTPTQVDEIEAVATVAPDLLMQPPKQLGSYTLRVRVGKDGKKRLFRNDVEISNDVLK
ncbi:unnamed protein product [Cuscuta europaea]|uniref:DUF4283 domain-containing protein n=1 Tax=Cuscuta europaea TaxID=41803 RepID=A0A9P1EGX3_CUSEU|nr:unnamed protein product [Cuscuta europaea]